MTIEAKLDKTNELLQAILTALSSTTAINVAADTKPKAETKPRAETKTAAPAPAPAAAPTPAPAPAPAAETSKVEPSFDDVVRTIMEINKSKEKGHGREGVLKVLAEFGFDASEGKRVPNLEALGKNAEILAFAKSVLEGQPATDDLGI